jgi:hypothetical protein
MWPVHLNSLCFDGGGVVPAVTGLAKDGHLKILVRKKMIIF